MLVPRSLMPLVLGAALFFSVDAAAQAVATVGWFDLETVHKALPDVTAARKRVARFAEDGRKKLEASQGRLAKTVDAARAEPNADKRAQMLEDIFRQQQDLEKTAAKLERDVQEREEKELKGINKKIEEAVALVAGQRGLTMVFDRTTSGLFFVRPGDDLSTAIVAAYKP